LSDSVVCRYKPAAAIEGGLLFVEISSQKYEVKLSNAKTHFGSPLHIGEMASR
jgi:hypothetical protein